jgi:hypothetical protein
VGIAGQAFQGEPQEYSKYSKTLLYCFRVVSPKATPINFAMQINAVLRSPRHGNAMPA